MYNGTPTTVADDRSSPTTSLDCSRDHILMILIVYDIIREIIQHGDLPLKPYTIE